MKPHRILAVLASILLATSQATQAWNESGHLQIAALAYGELTDGERGAVHSILTNHVKYPVWVAEHNTYRANTPDNREVSLGFYIFIRSSVWPDEIRDYDRPETHAYWHFITYPLRSPGYAYRVPLSPTNNVVFGIERSLDLVGDEHVSRQARAKYLSFLIHLIGDVHQPLHCGSLFNSRFTQADGDKGGNRFYVKETPSGSAKNLHSFWDGLLGSGDDPDNVKDNAATLKTEHPRASFASLLAVTDVRLWSRTSRNNAVNQAYRKFSSVTPTQSNPVLLPTGYKDGAKAVARDYAALAGYRLSDAVKQLVGGNP